MLVSSCTLDFTQPMQYNPFVCRYQGPNMNGACLHHCLAWLIFRSMTYCIKLQSSHLTSAWRALIRARKSWFSSASCFLSLSCCLMYAVAEARITALLGLDGVGRSSISAPS